MQKYFVITILVIFLLGNGIAFAEPTIMITYSDMSHVIWDGKWTFTEEWKPSSTDGGIRSAHDGKFIYMFADVVSDTDFVKGEDSAMICFDSNNTKSILADKNDYCFQSILGRSEGFTYQGGSPLESTGNFEKIANPDGFISVGGVSDQNDRYSDIPHAGYEFRIPIDFIGRSDVYGFYYVIHESHSNKFITWPANVTQSNQFHVPAPNNWGTITSPDKSLPEFQFPMIALIPAFFIGLFITRFVTRI